MIIFGKVGILPHPSGLATGFYEMLFLQTISCTFDKSSLKKLGDGLVGVVKNCASKVNSKLSLGHI